MNTESQAQQPPKVVLPGARKQGEQKQEAPAPAPSRFVVDSMIQDFGYVLNMKPFSYKAVLEAEGMDVVYCKVNELVLHFENNKRFEEETGGLGFMVSEVFEEEVKKLISYQVSRIAQQNGILSTKIEEIEKRGLIGVLQAMNEEERGAFTQFAEIEVGLRDKVNKQVLKGNEEKDEMGRPKLNQKQQNQANRMANDTNTVIRNQVSLLKDIRPGIALEELNKLPEEEKKKVMEANTLLTRFSNILNEYLTFADGIRGWEKAVRQEAHSSVKKWEVLVDSFWPVEVEKPKNVRETAGHVTTQEIEREFREAKRLKRTDAEKTKSAAPAKKGAGKKVVSKKSAKKKSAKKQPAKKGGKKK